MDENQIISYCQNGDLKQFSALYEKYIKKIYDFVYYKTGHRETAEDLASLVFVKALEKIQSFRADKGTFQAWLYRIARNTIIDHYRANKKEKNIDDVWDLASDDDMIGDFDAQEKIKTVEAYLKKLPSEQRDIVIMRIWQEMSHQEIAAALGKSEASIKMAYSRAIRRLREEMPLAVFLLFLFDCYF